MTAEELILDEFGRYYLGDELRVDDAFVNRIPVLAAASATRLARKSGATRESVVTVLRAMRDDRAHPLHREIGEQTLMWWVDDDNSWLQFQRLVDRIIESLGSDSSIRADRPANEQPAPALAVRRVVYDYGSAYVPTAHLGRLILTFDGETGTVDLTQEKGETRRAWRANLPLATWINLISTLQSSGFPKPPTSVEPPVPGSLPTKISWERDGQIESFAIAGTTTEYSDVTRIVWSILYQMVPGMLRGKPSDRVFPNTDIESPVEITTAVSS
jgi:hypothetical protein